MLNSNEMLEARGQRLSRRRRWRVKLSLLLSALACEQSLRVLAKLRGGASRDVLLEYVSRLEQDYLTVSPLVDQVRGMLAESIPYLPRPDLGTGLVFRLG